MAIFTCRERERQRQRQTDRQTDRPTDRRTDRQTDRQTERERECLLSEGTQHTQIHEHAQGQLPPLVGTADCNNDIVYS